MVVGTEFDAFIKDLAFSYVTTSPSTVEPDLDEISASVLRTDCMKEVGDLPP